MADHTGRCTVSWHLRWIFLTQRNQGIPFGVKAQNTGPADAVPSDVTTDKRQVVDHPNHSLQPHDGTVGQTVLRLATTTLISGTGRNGGVNGVDVIGLHAEQIRWRGNFGLERFHNIGLGEVETINLIGEPQIALLIRELVSRLVDGCRVGKCGGSGDSHGGIVGACQNW